jgi:hypothetical protein
MIKRLCLLSACLVLVVNSNAQLDIIWQRSIGGTDVDGSGFVFAGSSSFKVFINAKSTDGDFAQSKGGGDTWIMDFDFNGNELSKTCVGGTGRDYVNSVVKNPIGEGYYMAVNTSSSDGDFALPSGSTGLFISQINNQNQIVKNIWLNGVDSGYISHIYCTQDGHILASGWGKDKQGLVDTSFNNSFDAFLLNFDTAGTLLWKRIYGAEDYDQGNSIIETGNGTYLWGISSYSDGFPFTAPNYDNTSVYYFELDTNGVEVSSFGFNADSGRVGLVDVSYIGENSFLAINSIQNNVGNDVLPNPCAFSRSCWIVSFNLQGDIIWRRTMGGYGDDYATGFILLKDSSLVFSAISTSSNCDVPDNGGGDDYWLFKLDKYGNTIWSQTFGGSFRDEAYHLAELSPGKYVVVGATDSYDKDVLFNHNPSGAYADAWILILSDTSITSTNNLKFGKTITLHPNPAPPTLQFQAQRLTPPPL